MFRNETSCSFMGKLANIANFKDILFGILINLMTHSLVGQKLLGLPAVHLHTARSTGELPSVQSAPFLSLSLSLARNEEKLSGLLKEKTLLEFLSFSGTSFRSEMDVCGSHGVPVLFFLTPKEINFAGAH